MELSRVWKQAALFMCGAVAGFFIRDFAYWHGGLRTNSIYWLRGTLPPEIKSLREACAVANDAAVNNQVLVFTGDGKVFAEPTNHISLIYQMMTSLIELQVNNILLVATELAAYTKGLKWIEYCKKKGTRLHVLRRDIATPGALLARHIREQQSAKKFPVIRDLLMCGVNVLLSDFDVLFWDNPFKHIVGDADVEGMTDGWDPPTFYGFEMQRPEGLGLGFARWDMRVVLLNSGFFYVRASKSTIETMHNTWDMLTKTAIWDQAAFNCQVHAPLGTGEGRRLRGRGLSIRVMSAYLFSNSRIFHQIVAPLSAHSFFLPPPVYVPTGFKWPNPWGRPIAMHVNYHFHKVAVMAFSRRVFAKATRPSLAPPEPPRLAAPTALPTVPPPDLAEMCKIAQSAAVKRQVLAIVGDTSGFTGPEVQKTVMHASMTSLFKTNIKNVLLVATELEAYNKARAWARFAAGKGVKLHVARRYTDTPFTQLGRSVSEQTSAKKYVVLRDLLQCNVNVLLSDVNTFFWDDPFARIVDDADVEALTDGWDYDSAFGYEVNMGGEQWFPPWEWRVDFLSSGFFYVRASALTVKTMNATWNTVSTTPIWDHVAFNIQVRAPLGTGPQDRLQGQGLKIRVMNLMEFPNSLIFHKMVDPATLNRQYLPPWNAPTRKVKGFKWPTPWSKPVAMNFHFHQYKVQMMEYARRMFVRAR